MSSISTVNNGDTGADARAKINSNFANLNSDKLESSDITNLPHSGLDLDDGTNPHGTTKSDVGLGNVDNTADLDKPISTATQTALDDTIQYNDESDIEVFVGTANMFGVGDEIKEVGNTGIYKLLDGYLGRVNNPDVDTTYDLGGFDAHIFDWVTDPNNFRYISTGDVLEDLGRTPSFLATDPITYLYWVPNADQDLNPGGQLVERNTAPSISSYFNEIPLLRIVHPNNTNIAAVQSIALSIRTPLNQFLTYINAIGLFNISVNLEDLGSGQLANSSGYIIAPNTNTGDDLNDSHRRLINANNPIPFRHITQTQTIDASNVTTLDFGNYDDGGVVTAISGSGNRTTLMRIYVSPQNNWRVAYGQTIYSSIQEAIIAIQSDDFIANPLIGGNLVQIGIIAISKNGNDSRVFLTDNQGRPTGASTIIPISTMQDAYNNSSVAKIDLATGKPITIYDTNATTKMFEIDPDADEILMGKRTTFNHGGSKNLQIDTSGAVTVIQHSDGLSGLRIGANGAITIIGASGSTSTLLVDAAGRAMELRGDIRAGTSVPVILLRNNAKESGSTPFTASSDVQKFLTFEDADINQSGTAGFTLIYADVTETSTGSGERKLIDLKVDGAQVHRVDNDGSTYNDLGESVVVKTVQTTDATATTTATIPLDDDSVYSISTYAIGRDQAGTERAFYHYEGLYYRESGGNVVRQGGVNYISTIETTGSMTAGYLESGSNLLVRVLGLAATTINWKTVTKFIKVS